MKSRTARLCRGNEGQRGKRTHSTLLLVYLLAAGSRPHNPRRMYECGSLGTISFTNNQPALLVIWNSFLVKGRVNEETPVAFSGREVGSSLESSRDYCPAKRRNQQEGGVLVSK